MNSFLYGAMKEDYTSTGQCNLQIEKEGYTNLQISWALSKRNHYVHYLNQG